MYKVISIIVFSVLLFSPYGIYAEDIDTHTPLEGFDEFVETLMEEWEITGLAIAIVHENETIYQKGFGYRDIEEQLPVTHETIFAIASITKSITATALGLLVDEGKIEWDSPVREYLREFRLKDPYVTENMTIKDLLSHRSGLPRHDLLWYGSDFSREEIFQRLHYLEPSKSFRELYQYNNLMYLAAGVLIEEVTGMSWEEFIQDRILNPLQMVRTNFSVSVSKEMINAARPSAKHNDEIVHVPFRHLDAMGPVGSINSSVNEMAQWLKLNLNNGIFDNEQIVSENQLKEIHRPHMTIHESRDDPELFYASYGLGWRVGSYRGHKMLTHGGALDGFRALCGFLPDDDTGVIILTNYTERHMNPILMYNVFDRLLGLDEIDWNTRIRERIEKEEEDEENDKDTCKEDSPPTHTPNHFAGIYEHPAYGTVKVIHEDDNLLIERAGTRSVLEHCHFNIYNIEESAYPRVFRPELTVTFHIDHDAKIDRFSAPLDPNVDEIVFRKVDDDKSND